MMSRFSMANQVRFKQRSRQIQASTGFTILCLLLSSSPAFAHHAMDGQVPTTFFAGLLSGLAHPIIGLDHFVFVVSIGLLSAVQHQNVQHQNVQHQNVQHQDIFVPVAFVLAAMAGTGFYLTGLAFPGVEFFVAGSILLFGLLLALRNDLNIATVIGLGTIAGLCHGYVYGEAILGAEVASIAAYLLGFTVIQLVVILGAFGIGTVLLKRSKRQSSTPLQAAGWVICGVGLTFLTSQVVNAISLGV